MTKEQRFEWLSSHPITADSVKIMMTGTDEECVRHTYEWHKMNHDKWVLWGYRPTEMDRVVALLKKAVMENIGGSYMNKIDYWLDYCKENNITEY